MPELDLAAMSAAPAEALPPAKRVKTDPSYPPAMATGGWSSLPDDLVRRIADSFLATNDLDFYVDLRTVCRSWRAATDDPKKNTSDPRFRPRQWTILDEVFQSDTRRLLVNTATGRFLHKELPLLRDYYVVTTTLDGFFVLADRSAPHAARVFNPLTGGIILFIAPMPLEGEVSAAVSFAMPLPMLTLLCDSSRKHYTAFSDSECFTSHEHQHAPYNFFRRAVRGGFDNGLRRLTGSGEVFDKMGDLMQLLRVDPDKLFSDETDLPKTRDESGIRCFLIEFRGQVLIIVKLETILMFLMIEPMSGLLVRLTSISHFAIFIGHRRCLVVDADKFPSVEANCIYYIEHLGSSARICMYNFQDKISTRISGDIDFDFVKNNKQFVLVSDRPSTIIHLLSSYTMNTPDSQLPLQIMS